MTLVIDASVVVAALVDGGSDGAWAERIMTSEPLVAPHLMPAEVANILRRAVLAGDIAEETASISHGDLLDWRIELFPDTALRLARVTRMSADFWLGLQQDWDLWHAMRSKAADAIAELEPLSRAR